MAGLGNRHRVVVTRIHVGPRQRSLLEFSVGGRCGFAFLKGRYEAVVEVGACVGG